MKAIVCPKYGPPEVLQFAEVDKPTPRENEVLVKIHFTTVTVADCRVRAFRVPPAFWIPGRLALGITKPKIAILGSEMAGEVVTVGAAVTRFKPGDAVLTYAVHEGGAYAEYRCVQDGEMITHIPAGVPYEVAVAVPFGGITAFDFLKAADIQPGQRVLIYGASGSVGTYAVGLAHHFGADVTAVCSTANVEMVRSLGADRVLDYTKEDFAQGGQVYDIVFDTVGKTGFAQCRDVIKTNGYYLNAVMPFVGLKGPWYWLTARRHVVGGSPSKQPDVLKILLDMVAAGTLCPVIERVYPWEQIAEAHRHVDTGRKKGNVVVRVVP